MRQLAVLCLLLLAACGPTHARTTGGTSGSGSSGSTGEVPPIGSTTGRTSSGGTSGTTGGDVCHTPADCPGTDGFCQVRTCTGGFCGVSNSRAGMPLPDEMQVAGDCQMLQCDGKGRAVNVADATDVPNDNDPCTTDACTDGVPSHTPASQGTPCKGGTCDGSGHCSNNGCSVPGDCPGNDTECETRTCTGGQCGFTFATKGTALKKQVAGDCQSQQCDGTGGVVAVPDNNDLPVDNNPCTKDLCSGGIPSNPAASAGTACAQNGGRVCNGQGQCVACMQPSDCPGSDTACATRTCSAGVCGFSYAAAGTPLKTQVPGDCHTQQCDGAGNTVNAVDNSDVPNDSNPCTNDLCSNGTPTHTNATPGTACGSSGQTCNSNGQCGCGSPSDCPGSDTACATRTCSAGVCGFSYAKSGTVVGNPTPGDCHTNQCDGKGNVVNAVDNGDVPNDGNACTQDVCSSGVPSNPPAAAGTACNTGGGTSCDGQGHCVGCAYDSDCPQWPYLCSRSHACVPPLLISEIQTRGALGAYDEFVELYNPTSSPFVLDSNWRVMALGATSCPANGYFNGVRWTGTGVTIPSHGHVLLANSDYSQSVAPDGTLPSTLGISDGSSVILTVDNMGLSDGSSAGTYAIDAVCFAFDATTLNNLTGGCGTPGPYLCEGTPASSPHNNSTSSNSNVSLERRPGGSSGNGTDTDDNSADFVVTNPSRPQNTSSAHTP